MTSAPGPDQHAPTHRPPPHRRRPSVFRVAGFLILAAAVVAGVTVGIVAWLSSSPSPDATMSEQVSEVQFDDGSATLADAATNPSPSDAPSPPAGETTDDATDGASTIVDSSIQISELTPSDGATVGGEAVVITGAGFREGMRVRFADRDAPSVQVLNENKLRVIIPSGTPGDATVEVGSPTGASVVVEGVFAYVDRPPRVVMAIRPSSGTQEGGTPVTIVGTGFVPGARVVIGGEQAAEVTVVDSTRITALTAAHPEGIVDVIVRNPGMPAAILPGAYEYVRAPTICCVEPFTIPYEGGVTVTVTGTGFEPGIQVGFNGVAGRDVTLVDDRRLTVVAPPGIPGPITVAVLNPGQPMASLEGAAVYDVLPDPTPEPLPSPSEAENPDAETPPADPAAGAPAPAGGAPAAG